ncbi:acyltransferase family protein [Methylomonas fluvii]|uniref:Acyltransferase n=1 Tax=Methylomonas fluvii TaxID=1854564 RepID=A0ABR9DAL3_9GAMM|nr:acyltransferase [Methylomonas fluvii]MBD9359871.1 acyltransferase [Methylomonas fluvii]
MFGLFRLMLAIMVALSHFGLVYKGLNPGQWAVISFYLLSGYLMQLQFGKFTSKYSYKKAIAVFFTDRAIRIFPLYWVIVALIYITVGGDNYLINFTLFPLSYHELLDVKAVIFPAWSLATEMHFYLLVPLLFILNVRVLKLVMWISLIIFGLSPVFPHSTWWGYYGVPGMLFVFLAGMMLARNESIAGIFCAVIVLFVAFVAGKIFGLDIPSGINISACIGVFIAYFIIPYLAKIKQSAWDTKLGALTFPLFLSHPWVMEYFKYKNMFYLLVASVLFSLLLVLLIEKPIDIFRYWIRGRRLNNENSRDAELL